MDAPPCASRDTSIHQGRLTLVAIFPLPKALGTTQNQMDNVHKSLRVFVVDDEPTIAWTSAEILRKVGVDASAFTNPEEALRTAPIDIPDLLISDVVMPQLSS